MKVSGTKVAENRAALIATARRLLQERGFNGAGVIEISREAGLTQGALYGQFKSKDALAAEALRKAFAEGAAIWQELGSKAPDALSAYLDAYLCETHLQDSGEGCPMASCVSEVRRQDPAIAAAFTEGFETMVDLLQRALPETLPSEEARRRALTMVSSLVGSVAVARAVEPVDPALAKELFAAVRQELDELATRQ